MRSLIYVPIVHSEVDLGSIAGEIRRHFQNAHGSNEWTKRFASIDAMWDGLREKINSLPLSWASVRIYQDGLPVCEKEKEMVNDLAGKGSRNHTLLLELMGLGAVLMGTESAMLLVREYRRIQDLIQAARESVSNARVVELKNEGEVLLRERDSFMAQRIDTTLQEGETGILFVGLVHRVDEHLHSSINVRHLIHSLPFGAYPWRQFKGAIAP